MAITQAAVFCGGQHQGVHSDPPNRDPFPETLFCITWDDGDRYARTDEHIVDDQGTRRVLFRHDPDGSLTEDARGRFSDAPPR